MTGEPREQQLTEFFGRLKQTESPVEIQFLEEEIWELWMESGSAGMDVLMQEGIRDMANGDYNRAINHFSVVIDSLPDYAEAWNKRATAYYLRGDFKRSLDDVNETLRLEPRHFGALSGAASMFLAIGDKRSALKALEKMLEIAPSKEHLKEQIDELHRELGTRRI
ncbi:MAG: tetratricopeptide repeat protein [Bacteroidota bacterium]